MHFVPVAIALSMLSAGPSKNPSEPDPPVVSAADLNLKVWTTGKGRFLVLNMKEGNVPGPAFYGDATYVNQLRTPGGGSNGEDFNLALVDPHYANPQGEVSLTSKEGKTSITCRDKVIALTPLSEADTKAFLAKVVLREQLWRRSAHLLARDDDGTYYFIDSFSPLRGEPRAPKDPRLFVGPRGKMKQVEIVNAVFDSEGEIYKTKTGTFRLVFNAGADGRPDYRWVSGSKKLTLVQVPVEDNLTVIWNDLGVYSTKKYGSPCEDL